MARTPAGPGDYWAPLLGLVCVGACVAAFGTLLAAAGGQTGWLASAALLGAAIALGVGGYALLTRSGRKTGGWRRTGMDADEQRVYRGEFRAFSRRRRASGDAPGDYEGAPRRQ